ncbi:Bicoid-interacting protein 3-domain-containing protein [Aspergillus carlsbadensis]|nr:Bicoid-interacting protein 3-domain-containing protein [Aspergillus carlsbadensis]
MTEPCHDPQPPVTEPSRAERFKATHLAARHGNYHQYYAKFRAATIPDERLSILPSEILRNARVLDLGCNAGKLTHEAIAHCGAAAAVGVDIDPWLVEQAKAAYPDDPRCTFEQFDFVDGSAYRGSALGTFDVVLLLSVTKWVHLNNGDGGMLALFARVRSLLNEGGYLVIEPQPMSNYARASKRNKELREMYKTIRIQPPFDEELEAEGFERVFEFERDEEGFARPVHVWRKRCQKMNNGDGLR